MTLPVMFTFMDKLHAARDELAARNIDPWMGKTQMTFMDKLRAAKNEAAMRSIDPWLETLAGVRGQIDKGVERISTQLLLDILDVPQNERGKNYRRLAKLMASLVGPLNVC